MAAVTMMAVNQIDHPEWLSPFAAFVFWAAVAAVGWAHFRALRRGFRWRHLVPALFALIALLVILIGISPL